MRTRVPGVHIPEAMIARIERAADQRAEGRRICIELIRQIRSIEGIAGIHLMASKNESMIGEIVSESGVLAGRAQRVQSRGESQCPSPA